MGSLQGDVATSPSLSSTGSNDGGRVGGGGGGDINNGVYDGARIYACFTHGGSNSLECYEPGANTWRRVGPIPGVPAGHVLKGFAVVALGDSVFLIGGRLCRRDLTGESHRDTDVGVRADVLRYDARGGEWRGCAPLGVARFDFACAVCHGRICVAGGLTSLSGARGTAAAEVYDADQGRWTRLPDMSTRRYKCVGVTWQGGFHVVGGFAESTSAAAATSALGGGDVSSSSALERSSAEVFNCGRGAWEILPGMWQLDVPPNQIVAVAGRLFSSGDCLNSWKGHVEAYDGQLNIWSVMDHSAVADLSLLASLPPSAQQLYLTMAVVGTRLFFLAGYEVPCDDDEESFRTLSLVHSFDTSAVPGLVSAWSSFQPKMVDQENTVEDGSKELFSQCCSVQLSS
ncbi:uncharacterized protein LOC100842860 [Brachypodium distachyon]|uniref:F-box/kelch-repeat protein n=1 Tax=Brachypodium distachyon TaxID=15368 RepID=I1IDN6_BRADI|nr:uncharacterized protein LOC100842860 [Brachypodium distachyon]KQK01242.1 hypothetical protein BRADI_3g54650v3 [Brachypodium distachyon]|eukprot:XP_003570346.1 uncharacterized protein LOC100842860 [Brachypodium distachyon]